ncbi:MAG: hypothetical protein K1X57_04245 [Gemmataceae bacterium]|nr:hypothetical protein [Gemmataceae bacterium]
MTCEWGALALACGLGFATVYNGQPIGTPYKGDGFTIASTPYTTIKQGEQQTVEITINREDGFDRNLALQVASPKGLTATLATRRLTPSKGNVVTLNVVADKNAPVGRRVITVAAISDYGYAQPTTTGVHLIVEGS